MNKKEFMKNWSWLVQLHVDVEELFKDLDQIINSVKEEAVYDYLVSQGVPSEMPNYNLLSYCPFCFKQTLHDSSHKTLDDIEHEENCKYITIRDNKE